MAPSRSGTWAQVGTHRPHGTYDPGPIRGVSADGKTVVSGSYDGTIKVWDVGTGRERATLKGHTSLVTTVGFSANGKTLVSGSYDKTVKVWDVGTGRNARHQGAYRADRVRGVERGWQNHRFRE